MGLEIGQRFNWEENLIYKHKHEINHSTKKSDNEIKDFKLGFQKSTSWLHIVKRKNEIKIETKSKNKSKK
jgi:hypothetical protein